MLPYCERKIVLSVSASRVMLLFHTLLKRDNHLSSSHFLLSTLQLALFLTRFQIATMFMVSIQPLTYPVSLHQCPNLWDSLSLHLMGRLNTLCLSAYLASVALTRAAQDSVFRVHLLSMHDCGRATATLKLKAKTTCGCQATSHLLAYYACPLTI